MTLIMSLVYDFINSKTVTFVRICYKILNIIRLKRIMLRFMKNKILIPLIVLGALAAFFSFKYSGSDSAGEEKKVAVLETVMKAIKEGHYSPREINDTFSSHVYHKVLEEDYEKKFFTQQDINQLSKYEFQIDDEINSGSLEFYHAVNDIFLRDVKNAENYYKEILKTPFVFNGNDSVYVDGDKMTYAADTNALKDRWRTYLKYRVLAKYVDLKNAQQKKIDNKDTSLKLAKTDAQLEVEARDAVRKNQESYFKRLNKIKEDDRFSAYINAITGTEDPHTDYFPPRAKQRFDEEMSGTFFGIGAQLQQDGGKIKIVAIITGSPCWKQGELKAGDEIMKVAQGSAEPVDIEGYEIDDAVQLIRGKKGTEVRLTIKEPSGAIKVIPIVRGEVQQEDIFAKSVIIKSKGGPIGYIYLREFYSDFQHINGRRSAEDVKNEVVKLKAAGVKGIILDLRDNGGGSLSDVVDMAGIFIDNGPVVQVRSSDAAPMTLKDNSNGALYDGPMAVMVNENSASASEIMAAALQDYKRAVVVGSTTYGKGTVQKVIPLDEFLDPMTRVKLNSLAVADSNKLVTTDAAENSLGALKITVQKFYRVTGASTQLKGVTPDIVLPDPYVSANSGERHDKAALRWDVIPPSDFKPSNSVGNVPELASLSQARIAMDPTFRLIMQTGQRVQAEQQKNAYSLNESVYRKELEENNAITKKLEELQKKATPYEITNLKEDMSRVSADSASVAKNNDWIKNLKKDVYIAETVNIVNDMAKGGKKVTINSKR